jgi:hypothetical protein
MWLSEEADLYRAAIFAAASIFQSKQILQELRGAKKIRLKNRHMQNQ